MFSNFFRTDFLSQKSQWVFSKTSGQSQAIMVWLTKFSPRVSPLQTLSKTPKWTCKSTSTLSSQLWWVKQSGSASILLAVSQKRARCSHYTHHAFLSSCASGLLVKNKSAEAQLRTFHDHAFLSCHTSNNKEIIIYLFRLFLPALAFGIFSILLTPNRSLSAERITFYYPPLGDFSVSTYDLEVFANTGKITTDFDYYARRVTPEQLKQLQDLLSTRFQLSPTLVSQFTYLPVGETVLRRLGKVLKTETRQNGFYALRSAFILAAKESGGFTVLNLLRRFPSNTLRLDFQETVSTVRELTELLKRRDSIVNAIALLSTENASQSQIDFSQKDDLRSLGKIKWQLQSFTLEDKSRKVRKIPVDLYLPDTSTEAGNVAQRRSPLIVISHGVAEDKQSFAYLAKHLASYGFGVAVVEHVGDSAQKFQQFFAGLNTPPDAIEMANRPLDIKLLLDTLQADSKYNTKLDIQKVGLVGHSLGGYTVLALAGAKVNLEEITKNCRNNQSLNISTLLQCEAVNISGNTSENTSENKLQNISEKFSNLQDSRIKAVVAVNPFSSWIFGERGMGEIKVPLMMVAGSQDIITPAVPEQIRPFTWLKQPDKYLLVINNATHFSVTSEAGSDKNILPVPPGLIGPNPELARTQFKAMTLAFMQNHLTNSTQSTQYSSYLSSSYTKHISQEPLNLSIIKSFTKQQFTEASKQVGVSPNK
jgi:predicted dienelactone hydrolase